MLKSTNSATVTSHIQFILLKKSCISRCWPHLRENPKGLFILWFHSSEHNRFHTSVNFPVLFLPAIYKHPRYTNLSKKELICSSVIYFLLSQHLNRRELKSLNFCLFHLHCSFRITFCREPIFKIFCRPSYNKAFHWTHVCSKNSHRYKLCPNLPRTHFNSKPDEIMNKVFDRNKFECE